MSANILNNSFEQWSTEEFCPIDLHTAASIGCLEKVQEIIKNSVHKEVNLCNRDGWTPLMYAACYGDSRVVRFLLKAGADPNHSHRKCSTPLIVATKSGDLESAIILVENGADVNSRDFNEWTALFYAASYGHRAIQHMLISKGSRVNQSDTREGMTPLLLAAAAGHELIVKDLLQCGASLSASSKSGDTALSLALKNGHVKVKNVIDAHLFHKQDSIPPMLKSPVSFSAPSSVRELLDIVGLSKYYPIFESHGIDLTKFFSLTDENLKEMGIVLIGPRKKIANAISRWKSSHQFAANTAVSAVPTKAIGHEL